MWTKVFEYEVKGENKEFYENLFHTFDEIEDLKDVNPFLLQK